MHFVSSFGRPSSLVYIASAHTGLRIQGSWWHNFLKVYNVYEITFILHENMNAVIIGVFHYL